MLTYLSMFCVQFWLFSICGICRGWKNTLKHLQCDRGRQWSGSWVDGYFPYISAVADSSQMEKLMLGEKSCIKIREAIDQTLSLHCLEPLSGSTWFLCWGRCYTICFILGLDQTFITTFFAQSCLFWHKSLFISLGFDLNLDTSHSSTAGKVSFQHLVFVVT